MTTSQPADDGRSEGASVAALKRGLLVLDVFARTQESLGVNEISRLIGLHKSTVSRLCATLESAGYLERDSATNRFTVGPRAYDLAHAPHVDQDMRAIARPILEELAKEGGETVSLAVVRGVDVIVIDVVEGPRFVRMRTEVGMHAHLSASAAAKAIVAWMPEAELRELVGDGSIRKLTPNTLTDFDDFVADLEETRRRGYSMDMEELEIGLRCVGAEIRGRGGDAVAAISVSGPRHRMSVDEMRVLGSLARQGADKISQRLGAPAASPL